ncbi:MAG: hypothetical protein ABIJ48_12355 [Actinomycetota bacterium]
MTEEYIAGVCNIGPAETARRRRVGERGAVAAGGLLAVLVVARAPRAWRLLAAIPATVSAAGYLQAARHFCANFGWRGVANFGVPGSVEQVGDTAAHAEDRARAQRIAVESVSIGLAVGLLALMPGGWRRRRRSGR